MVNLDEKDKIQAEMKAEVAEAIASGDSDKISFALASMATNIQANLLSEYRAMTAEMLEDKNALAARGIQPLTKAEKEYYTEVIQGAGFENVEKLVPPTVINRVFEELVREHPLFSHIEFQNVGAVTKWIIKKGNVPNAWWGKLNAELKEILDEGFEVLQTDLFKLTAAILVHKDMLALGPEWLDKYVRTIIFEAMSLALEFAIVAGTGVDMPVGMIRDMETFSATTGYPERTAKPITDLSPATLGKEVMAPLTKEGKRKVDKVLMVVNPLDYWERFFPATTMLTSTGHYISGVLSVPAVVVQSIFMPRGKMIAGIGKDYFLGVGSNRKIEKSDEYRFFEDQRAYASKQYANGKPKDNDSFLYYDISNLDTTLSACGGYAKGEDLNA